MIGVTNSAVQSSLDLLKLFLSGMRKSGIRQAHRSGHSPNVVELTRDEGREFHIGWRRGPEDAVVDDNWHAIITGHYNWPLATKVLQSSSALGEPRKLYQRFLDALTWYGDGVSDETYAGKLVKFVAALERITVTSGEKAGYNKVARRAAILASDRTEEGWLKYFRATQAVHSWRSNLMHGSGSPFDRSVPRHAANAEHISRWSLFRYLDLIRNLPADPRSDENWLATQYGRLESAYPKS